MIRRLLPSLLLVALCPTGLQAQICNGANIQESTPVANFVTALPSVDPAGKYTGLSPLASDGSEVLDLTTGLVWQRCSVGQTWNASQLRCDGIPSKHTWQEALTLSNGFWRLPNIKELVSLIDFRCQAPPLNPEIFPDTPASILYQPTIGGSFYGTGYWSSTPNISPGLNIDDPKIGGWIMDLNLGVPYLFSVEANNPTISYPRHFARLVRSQ